LCIKKNEITEIKTINEKRPSGCFGHVVQRGRHYEGKRASLIA